MRVALVHDWLTCMRGGERVLQEIAEFYPEADLYTLIHVPGTVSPEIERHPIHASPLSRLPGVARYYRILLPIFPWAIRRFDLSDYDLVISISHAVAKGVRTGPDTTHLCYCLTPMRYVWDQIDAYLGRRLLRLLALPLVTALRVFDRRTSGPEDVTRFTAISSNVRDRIAARYGRGAGCVHPPVNTDDIQPNQEPPEDFYLLVGAFVPYKGEAIAVEAFSGWNRRLVVVGDGPARKALAESAPGNVEFLGHVSDAELRDLYARCRALIYPQEEDFGITAVEAQAAGRPVIAFGRGGAVDTVRPLGREDVRDPAQGPATGIHFSVQSAAALREAVLRFESNASAFDVKAIRAWAERFGRLRFRREFSAEVARALDDHRSGCPDRSEQ
jgi:glycosyltransferase involved in cell wall biosynthesis